MSIHDFTAGIIAGSKASARSGFTLLHLTVVLILLAVVAMAQLASVEIASPAAGKRIVQAESLRPAADDIHQCTELYAAWSSGHANEGITTGNQNWIAESAMAACEHGDVAGGKQLLEQLFRGEAPAQTAWDLTCR